MELLTSKFKRSIIFFIDLCIILSLNTTFYYILDLLSLEVSIYLSSMFFIIITIAYALINFKYLKNKTLAMRLFNSEFRTYDNKIPSIIELYNRTSHIIILLTSLSLINMIFILIENSFDIIQMIEFSMYSYIIYIIVFIIIYSYKVQYYDKINGTIMVDSNKIKDISLDDFNHEFSELKIKKHPKIKKQLFITYMFIILYFSLNIFYTEKIETVLDTINIENNIILQKIIEIQSNKKVYEAYTSGKEINCINNIIKMDNSLLSERDTILKDKYNKFKNPILKDKYNKILKSDSNSNIVFNYHNKEYSIKDCKIIK